MKTVKDLENVVANLPTGGEIHINTINLTYDAETRLKYYIQDGILSPFKAQLENIYGDNEDLINKVLNGDIILPNIKYAKLPTRQDIADSVEKAYIPIIEHYEARNLELSARVDELNTQLLQYQVYVSDLTTAIQKNICKDFLPNIGQTK